MYCFLLHFFSGLSLAQRNLGLNIKFSFDPLICDTNNLFKEAQRLKNYVDRSSFPAPIVEMVRDLILQLNKTLVQVDSAFAKINDRKEVVTQFTEGRYRVKPVYKLKAKLCNFKRVQSLNEAFKHAEVLNEPFIISNFSFLEDSQFSRLAAAALANSTAPLKLKYWDPKQVVFRQWKVSLFL